MRKFLTRWLKCLAQWKVRVGIDPSRAEAPVMILFPLQRSLMACGLAGVLTVKRAGLSPEGKTGDGLYSLWDRLSARTLLALGSAGAGMGEYLGGDETVREIDRGVQRLKEDARFADLFFDGDLYRRLDGLRVRWQETLSREDQILEERASDFTTEELEIIGGRLTLLKDAAWTLHRDILEHVPQIRALAGAEPGALTPSALGIYRKLNYLLHSLNRLEVRGRDSAGIHLRIFLQDRDVLARAERILRERGLQHEYRNRSLPADLLNRSIERSGAEDAADPSGPPALGFTYKTASVIGELGKNIRELRGAIETDRVLRVFADAGATCETCLVHTRWASVGSITEENCHPVNDFVPRGGQAAGATPATPGLPGPAGSGTIDVVLNGDIDNYASLRRRLEAEGWGIAPEITTDTKIIPLQIARHLRAGQPLAEAFRLAVNAFEGSHAIAMTSTSAPGKVYLAVRGSGQTIYVGIAPDRYVFASELYGLVEATPRFIRMDGEIPADPDDPSTTGQILVLDPDAGGGTEGIAAFHYDGSPWELDPGQIRTAEITTRDIDRGVHPHFFLKEIGEAGLSVKKTLRGRYRIAQENGISRVAFNLGRDVIPDGLAAALREKRIRQIRVIGHGTAAVAGQAVADAMERHLRPAGLRIGAMVASEFSGFFLAEDLRDTLVVPITQSGSTTDTNRAVALAAERGATIIAIVNRRQSDITSRAHGVFYTSDGRDIEMSVASTKAFYSQIVAGHILALALARTAGTMTDPEIARALRHLEEAPALMERVLAGQERIREAAETLVMNRSSWAVVGSGPNKAAADEIRIKLSELCYKTISSDVVENKKHIDLSAEPLIIVCAAGTAGNVLEDIVKDVAIFKAHRAAVLVFADEGESRFDAVADRVIPLPPASDPLPVILNTMAGHLWGYHAARCIDEDAGFLRDFRSRLDLAMVEQARRRETMYDRLLDRHVRSLLREFGERFNERRRKGHFSQTSAKTISDIVLLLKYAAGKLPLEDFWPDFGDPDETISPVDLLDSTLGHAVDELSRPIDAIRHQAKTVTVGTSRREEPPAGILFDLLRELNLAGRAFARSHLPELRRIQRTVREIRGYTLYAVEGLDEDGAPGEETSIRIADRGGISREMASRTERSRDLRGTKRTLVSTGRIYVGTGRADGVSIVMLPLLGEGGGVRRILLVHVSFDEALDAGERKRILGDRVANIRNLAEEYNLVWRDRFLEGIPVATLLGEPDEVIVERIRNRHDGGASDGSAAEREIP